MALLYRFVRAADRGESHVFTFIVTRSVTRDLERDVASKEFTCGHHRWAITFSRTDKVLGVYLVWRSTSVAMRVYVDFTFTIMNREHFSVNEAFTGKQSRLSTKHNHRQNQRQKQRKREPVKFTLDCPAQGNRNYIAVSDLYNRNFTDPNGEFQLELCMGHVRTVFDTEFRLPRQCPKAPTKLETTYFNYGGFDWNLALYPYGIKEQQGPPTEGRISVYLNRNTGFDHQCRVRYSLVLGDGDRRLDSGIVDDVSDLDGKSYGWHPRARFSDFLYKGGVRVHVEMVLANTLSEVISKVTHDPQLGLPNCVITGPPTQCYDRDKQGWSIQMDSNSDSVRLHMVFSDIHNIPRNHLRYVSWSAYILRFTKTGQLEPVILPGSPFSHYYAQEPQDEGIIMETDLTIKELSEPGCPFLSDKGQLRVQVEWEESYLLFQSVYHKYDDVSRLHNHQMRKEIAALQAENYSLERQLFSYQKSIAFAHSRGTYSDDLASIEGRGAEEEEDYYEERATYSMGERSLSTDTEYA